MGKAGDEDKKVTKDLGFIIKGKAAIYLLH